MIGDVFIAKPGNFNSGELGYKMLLFCVDQYKDKKAFVALNILSVTKIHELVDIIPSKVDQLVRIGGTIDTDLVYYLHTLDLPESKTIRGNLSFSADPEEFERKSNLGLLDYSKIRFFCGVTIATDREIAAAFVKVNIDNKTLIDWIFNEQPENLYLEATKRLGGYMPILGTAEHFSPN